MTIGESLLYCLMIVAWVLGIALSLTKVWWMTLLSVTLPPFAWVLVAQWFLEK